MKLIHLSDCHIIDPAPKNQPAAKPRPHQTLCAIITDICQWHKDADLCVVSGDLTHDGTLAQYRLFGETIAALPMPVHVIPGNHDEREPLLATLPATARDENGFINYALTHQGIRIIMLDTLADGEDFGNLCPQRLAWLANELQQSQDLPCLIFMHHPPLALGLPFMDAINLQNADAFGDILQTHPAIRHIFFGHTHRPFHAIWRGIPITGGASTFAGQPLAMQPGMGLPDKPWLEPGYGIALINKHDATVRYHFETVRMP